MKSILFYRKKVFIIFILIFGTTTLFSTTKNIQFSVDLSFLIIQGKFNTATDIAYIRGTFNNWDTTIPLSAVGNNVYSVTIPLAENSYQEYKYFINTSGAAGGG